MHEGDVLASVASSRTLCYEGHVIIDAWFLSRGNASGLEGEGSSDGNMKEGDRGGDRARAVCYIKLCFGCGEPVYHRLVNLAWHVDAVAIGIEISVVFTAARVEEPKNYGGTSCRRVGRSRVDGEVVIRNAGVWIGCAEHILGVGVWISSLSGEDTGAGEVEVRIMITIGGCPG